MTLHTMTYFRQHKKQSKQVSDVDGFISRNNAASSGSTDSVHQRFRTSYKPQGSVGDLRAREEGFTSRQSAVSLQESSSSQAHDGTFPETIDLHEERPKRRGLWPRRSRKAKKPSGPFKKVAKSFALLFIALIVGVSSLFAYGYIKARNIFRGDGEGAAALQENVDPSRLNGEGDGRVNILVIGKGGPGHEAPDLTDTLLLGSIDPVANEAAMVSVPRDLYVQDANGNSSKINAIYSNAKQARLANGDDTNADRDAAEDAGLDAIKDAVSEVLGIPVHYYVMVDFTAFQNAIDTVGGITVNVKEPLYDQSVAWLLGGNPLVADSGLQTFDGERALLYARSRKGSARGDFDRTERQREIVIALQDKVLSLGTFSNPFKVLELMNTFGDRVRTDLNGLDEIRRLYDIGQQIPSDKVASVGLADPPNILVTTDFVAGQSVVVPTAGLYQYDEIHSYIRNNLRDAFLKSENSRVIILNGTSISGLATATQDELRSYGYNVVSVDNAPTSDYIQNVLIDQSGGNSRYTKSYLERRLGLTATTATPVGIPGPEEADFVIILGTDEATQTLN